MGRDFFMDREDERIYTRHVAPYKAKIIELEAQVAELAKLLSQCAEVMWGTNGMMRRAAYGTLPEQVDKALAAVRGQGGENGR